MQIRREKVGRQPHVALQQNVQSTLVCSHEDQLGKGGSGVERNRQVPEAAVANAKHLHPLLDPLGRIDLQSGSTGEPGPVVGVWALVAFRRWYQWHTG